MTAARVGFERAFQFILKVEGGYSDDPKDRGRETNYGISKRTYPNVEIIALTIEEARAIYWRDFWLPCRCDEMPASFAVALFDAAVHHGASQAVRLLQCGLGVKIDGLIGPKTLAAAWAATVDGELPEFLSWRAHYMSGLPAAPTYFRGWMRRLFRLEALCLGIAGQ